jgi:hypothetical protein
VAPTRSGQHGKVLDILGDLAVATLGFPAGAPVALAQLRAGTQSKMPDCCVPLSARDQKARPASFYERVINSRSGTLEVDVVEGSGRREKRLRISQTTATTAIQRWPVQTWVVPFEPKLRVLHTPDSRDAGAGSDRGGWVSEYFNWDRSSSSSGLNRSYDLLRG